MSEHTITVAGVAVDTRHWIGGERVASAQTFPDVSPIDGSTIGEHLPGHGHGGSRRRGRREGRLPRLGGHLPRGTRTHPARHRRRGREADRRALHRRDHRQRSPSALPPPGRHAPRRPQLPLLRGLAAETGARGLRDARAHQPRQLGPSGPLRADHTVERPADAGHLEGRPGSRGRQHGDPQARRVDPADCLPAGRHRRRGRAPGRCPQRRPGLRLRDRRRADLASRRAPDQLHRLRAHGQADRGVGGREPHAL